MTVQSAEEAAFDQAYITVLQTMADQVAVAIANARLFADAQTAVEDLQAAQQRYLGKAWARYAQERGVRGYAQTHSGLLTLDQQILPEVHRAIAAGHPVIGGGRTARGTDTQVQPADLGEDEGAEPRGDDSVQPSALVVPILSGHQPIGALGLRDVTGRRHWSEIDVGLVQAISEQFAQAAESLRLLDETERSVAREKTVTRVTARVRETLDVATVLQTAAREMRDVLNLAEAEVRIGTGTTPDEA
jgi:GAF domain-containing protein